MVFLYTILLTLGIVICNSLSSHASPRPLDERSTQPSFLNRNIPHLLHHSHTPLNTSELPQNHSNPHPLVGTIIPCTSDEKICLRYNMVFVPSAGNCQPVGISGLCNITIARSTTGNVFGECGHLDIYIATQDEEIFEEENPNEDPITENVEPKSGDSTSCSGYIMAFSRKCHTKDEVRDICGCDDEPTPHDVLGGYVCNCPQPTPIEVHQPEEDGLCRVPDFQFPDFQYPYNSNIPTFLNCSDHQFHCFVINKIWMPEDEKCYTPLERGPCPEDYVVGLNYCIGQKGIAEGACVHVRGDCPSGYKRLAYDLQCHPDREIEIRRIDVTLSPYGLFDQTPHWKTSIYQENDTCLISYLYKPADAGRPVAVPGHAVQNDQGGIDGTMVNSNQPNPSMLMTD